jgi:hypothetical protein
MKLPLLYNMYITWVNTIICEALTACHVSLSSRHKPGHVIFLGLWPHMIKGINYEVPFLTLVTSPVLSPLALFNNLFSNILNLEVTFHIHVKHWAELHAESMNQIRSLRYILTYLLTIWSWTLLERPLDARPLDSFPAFHATQRFNTEFTRALHCSYP